MNLKVLFVAFLCLFSASVICNVTSVTLNTPQRPSCRAFVHAVHRRYLITNGTEPTGDPIGGGGWPR